MMEETHGLCGTVTRTAKLAESTGTPGTLRKTYGVDFAKGCAESDRLSDVLHEMDEPSLSKLVRDHEAGKLEQICKEAT
jgi:hypothetical protein